MTAEVICARGALTHLPDVLSELKCHSIFLVTGRTSFERSGAKSAIERSLKGFDVTTFSDATENPNIVQLEQGLQSFRDADADLVLAIGGGSVIDMAKLIKTFSQQALPVRSYVQNGESLSATNIPFVAIPTTAGSGSQATHFAVLYIGKNKYSVADRSMLPNVALIDPDLLKSLPPAVTASTGLDALNQAIESYWSVQANDESKGYAGEAISLAWKNLPASISNSADAVRLAMARAAHLAGKAINITKTTAPHAISYPITSHFGVPHGHAVGLVTAEIMLFNSMVCDDDCLDARGSAYVRAMLSEIAGLMSQPNVDDAARAYNGLMDDVALTRNFQELGIRSRKDLEIIISNGFNPQRVNNNPRKLTESSLRKILLGLMG